MVQKKIETTSDIRYKAWKEMLNFCNWIAENHPKVWFKLCEKYEENKPSPRRVSKTRR